MVNQTQAVTLFTVAHLVFAHPQPLFFYNLYSILIVRFPLHLDSARVYGERQAVGQLDGDDGSLHMQVNGGLLMREQHVEDLLGDVDAVVELFVNEVHEGRFQTDTGKP